MCGKIRGPMAEPGWAPLPCARSFRLTRIIISTCFSPFSCFTRRQLWQVLRGGVCRKEQSRERLSLLLRFHIFLTKISRQPFRSFKWMLADRRLATANLSATTISPRTLTRYLPISIASTSLRPIFGPKGIRLRCFLPCVYNLPNAGEIRTAELLD